MITYIRLTLYTSKKKSLTIVLFVKNCKIYIAWRIEEFFWLDSFYLHIFQVNNYQLNKYKLEKVFLKQNFTTFGVGWLLP